MYAPSENQTDDPSVQIQEHSCITKVTFLKLTLFVEIV
jgi:hypothetical protein